MTPKTKELKRSTLQIMKKISESQNLSLEKYRIKNKQKDWYSCRDLIRANVKKIENPEIKINHATGVFLKYLRTQKKDVFDQQLFKKQTTKPMKYYNLNNTKPEKNEKH